MFTKLKVTTSLFSSCHIVYRDGAKDSGSMTYVLICRCSELFRCKNNKIQISTETQHHFRFEKCLSALVTEIIFTEMYLLGEGSEGQTKSRVSGKVMERCDGDAGLAEWKHSRHFRQDSRQGDGA